MCHKNIFINLYENWFQFIIKYSRSFLLIWGTVYPKKYAHGFCFAVLCCGYTLTDFPISIRLTSLALWQSNDCPSASKATLMNMDKYFMWIHYEWFHNHNKAKHNKTVCIFLGIYCMKGNTTTPPIFSLPVDIIISLEIIEFLIIFIQPSFTKSNKRGLYVQRVYI